MTPDEYIREIKEITPKEIREVANKYLPSQDGNYALLIRDPLKSSDS